MVFPNKEGNEEKKEEIDASNNILSQIDEDKSKEDTFYQQSSSESKTSENRESDQSNIEGRETEVQRKIDEKVKQEVNKVKSEIEEKNQDILKKMFEMMMDHNKKMKEEIISELKYAIDGKIEENNKMISEKIEENLKIRSSFFGASHGDLSKSENQRQFIEGLDEIMRSSIHNRKSRHTEYINQNDKRKVDLNNVEIIQRRDFDQSNTRRLDNSEESKTKEEEDDKEDIFYDCE